MDTPLFFRQAANDQFTGSIAYLDSQQSIFHFDQTSGMIEIKLAAAEWAILLFARGISTGTYHLKDNSSKPISINELHTLLGSSNVHVCTQTLPDIAGRAVWLALQSQVQSKNQIQNIAGWDAWLNKCKVEKVTGLVQIASEFFDGFVYLQEGELIKTESIFSTDQGFLNIPPFFRYQQDFPCELTIYTSAPDSHAYQTFILRHGVSDWIRSILDRYKEMVGQRLVQVVINQSNISIEPWHWKIQLEGTALRDHHFFPDVEAAVKAYRALLMSMGEQISPMIGNMLTQRLVTETYNQLSSEETRLLELQRLIPASLA
jgi:hypothetical protein